MAATVTIDKAYFETLLRRAEFHVSGEDHLTPVDLPIVSIPKVDHDNLLRMAQEYSMGQRLSPRSPSTTFVSMAPDSGTDFPLACLRESLYRGGIESSTLEMLIRGDIGQTPAESFNDEDRETNGGVNLLSRPSKNSVTISRPLGRDLDHFPPPGWPSKNTTMAGQKDRGGFYARHYSFGQDDGSFPSDPEKEEQHSSTAKTERQQYARAEQRTILAKNLADRTTHKDIVENVRGGALLDIFLRANDRSASISFVEGAAAQNFMNHAKRNDIYIHGKRLEFVWNDRQFVLPGHVANKIGIGATRNLVIRAVHPNITEQRLREDLDHIHNLIIISLYFRNGDAYLSLNSIHNSLFARTCMMSRAMYKGMRIEWYPDECAQPLLKAPFLPRKETPQRSGKKSNPISNRFQMLNMDGTEDGTDETSDEDTVDVSAGLTSFSPMGHRSPWNTRPVVA